jgi:hypothetical protein
MVPMMGFEPIPRFSRERILSPLRLPFRHIGVQANLTRGLAQTKRFSIYDQPRPQSALTKKNPVAAISSLSLSGAKRSGRFPQALT